MRDEITAKAVSSRLTGPATEKQLGYMNGLLNKCFVAGESVDVARHQFLEYVFGNPSSKGLTKAEASAVIEWVKDEVWDGPHHIAVKEAHMVLNAWAEERGQEKLL